MSLIFDKKVSRVDTFTYRINGGGQFFIKDDGDIKIIFANKRFHSAEVPFRERWTRNQWRILADVEREITALESELSKEDVIDDKEGATP